jgi:hypothetical protein
LRVSWNSNNVKPLKYRDLCSDSKNKSQVHNGQIAKS